MNLCHSFLALVFARKWLNARVGHSHTKCSALELSTKKTSELSEVFSFSLQERFYTPFAIFRNYEASLIDTSFAVLSWCNGCIATLTKLPVRVRSPSTAPQPQVIRTDLLVSIKKSGKLSKSLEETRGPFNWCGQRRGQPHQSLMQPFTFEV